VEQTLSTKTAKYTFLENLYKYSIFSHQLAIVKIYVAVFKLVFVCSAVKTGYTVFLMIVMMDTTLVKWCIINTLHL